MWGQSIQRAFSPQGEKSWTICINGVWADVGGEES